MNTQRTVHQNPTQGYQKAESLSDWQPGGPSPLLEHLCAFKVLECLKLLPQSAQ